MRYSSDQPKKTLSESLLGSSTPAKASGAAFSLAAVVPVFLSCVFVIVLALTGVSKQDGYAQNDWYIYISYLLSPVAFALVAVWYFRYSKTPIKQTVKAQNCPVKYYFVALLLQVGLFSLSELNAWFLSFLERFGYTDSGIALPSMDGFGFVAVLLAVAVLPAVFEEILFRGVILDGLKAFGETGAVLICGALFSLYHQNPAQTLYQFCCGAAFALVAIRAGSILPTVLSHFVNNAFILTLTKFGVYEIPAPVKRIVLAVGLVALALSLVYLLVWDKSKKIDAGDKTERKRFFKGAAVGIAVCALTWILTLIA